MGRPRPFSVLRAVQWLLDEWEEGVRIEVAVVPSDNAVSSVTLTTAASKSNMLIIHFLHQISRGLFLVPGLASAARAVCFHHPFLTSTTTEKI